MALGWSRISMNATQKTLVLLIPGFWRTRRYPAMVTIATGLAELGPSVCVVDNRGHGEEHGHLRVQH